MAFQWWNPYSVAANTRLQEMQLQQNAAMANAAMQNAALDERARREWIARAEIARQSEQGATERARDINQRYSDLYNQKAKSEQEQIERNTAGFTFLYQQLKDAQQQADKIKEVTPEERRQLALSIYQAQGFTPKQITELSRPTIDPIAEMGKYPNVASEFNKQYTVLRAQRAYEADRLLQDARLNYEPLLRALAPNVKPEAFEALAKTTITEKPAPTNVPKLTDFIKRTQPPVVPQTPTTAEGYEPGIFEKVANLSQLETVKPIGFQDSFWPTIPQYTPANPNIPQENALPLMKRFWLGGVNPNANVQAWPAPTPQAIATARMNIPARQIVPGSPVLPPYWQTNAMPQVRAQMPNWFNYLPQGSTNPIGMPVNPNWMQQPIVPRSPMTQTPTALPIQNQPFNWMNYMGTNTVPNWMQPQY